ncbi:MAG: hypothetical protein HRT88_05970 [Lentisphaeraceae bacterium]|nr:hypothetical protein [Lentisphaeraceae bacterium]
MKPPHNENEYDEYDDFGFEDHEVYSELNDNEDYEGLIKFSLQKIKDCPDDLSAVIHLTEAYISNGECVKAIEFIVPYLKESPECEAYQWIVLSSLYKLGKTEKDYDWIIKPVVIQLDEKLMDKFYKQLRLKRKARSIYELHTDLVFDGHLLFSHIELLALFKKDNRFHIDSDCGITVRK